MRAIIAGIVSSVILIGLVLSHDNAVRWVASKHVVMVLHESGGGGTGFFIEEGGESFILTNSHVCDTESTLIISTGGTGDVIAIDEDRDLCLLVPSKAHSGGITLADSWVKGEAIRVLGHGLLLPLHEQLGRVEDQVEQWIIWQEAPCADGQREEMTWFGSPICAKLFPDVLFLSADIKPGNSGSPVIDVLGHAVGIVFAGGGGFGYAIPVEEIRGFISELRLGSGLCVVEH